MRTITVKIRPALEVKDGHLDESGPEWGQCFEQVQTLLKDFYEHLLSGHILSSHLHDLLKGTYPWLKSIRIHWEISEDV